MPAALEGIRNPSENLPIDVVIAENNQIADAGYSLWCYDYTEVLPSTSSPQNLQFLGDHIKESGHKFAPSDSPDRIFRILGVSNTDGIFVNEQKRGNEIKQKYIAVQSGDLVYNPHRVNVGSIGVVPDEIGREYDHNIVSGIYVVFRPINPDRLPAEYLCYLLKTKDYLEIIRAYDTRHGAVRANLNWDQLCRIRIMIPLERELAAFQDVIEKEKNLRREINATKDHMSDIVKTVYT